MLPDSVYGFASDEDVSAAINARMADTNPDCKEALAKLLGEAVFALLEINGSIPVQSKHRHLIANALELFASPPEADIVSST